MNLPFTVAAWGVLSVLQLKFPRLKQRGSMSTLLSKLFARHAFFAILLAGLMICLPLMAQVIQGKIGGNITDQSGGAIPGAMVTVTDVERGVTRTLTTDASGAYSAPNLTPGSYTVHVEFMGFRPLDRKDIAIGVGQDVRIDATMQPGDQTQTVTVTGEPPAINTTNAQMGGAIEAAAITDLPISGRSFVYALSYRPGMQVRPGAGGGNVADGGGASDEEDDEDDDGVGARFERAEAGAVKERDMSLK